MINQSFSAENFRKIFDYENRKGNYLESDFFPELKTYRKKINEEVDKYQEKISQRNIKIESYKQENKKLLISVQRGCKLIEFKRHKAVVRSIKRKKEEFLMKKLGEISQNINNSIDKNQLDFKINIASIIKEKVCYTIPKGNPELYFASKQLQYNLKKSFKVKQADRFQIAHQLKLLLEDNFPKYVVRTDIKEFYESIPHNRLMEKIKQNSNISIFSIRMIENILHNYNIIKEITNPFEISKGIPRGVGISAYLAELYLKEMDTNIKSMPNLVYYARYVDDIIAIFVPEVSSIERDYNAELRKEIENECLKMNESKTEVFNLDSYNDSSTQKEIEYLGYKFTFKQKAFCQVGFTKNKLDRYKEKIKLVMDEYLKNTANKKNRRLLILRLAILTGNTQLQGNKRNVYVGIFFSNPILTDVSVLAGLDSFLNYQVSSRIACSKLKNRLSNFSFLKGFQEKKFTSLNPKHKIKNAMKDVFEIWKNL